MATKPKLITICPDCQREDVGVVIDWAHRDSNNKVLKRYRVARHKVKYLSASKDNPFCINGRSLVPDELIFERK